MTDEPASRSWASQGLALRYADWGNEGAPTLLLVHGTRDHARSWDWTARAFRDRWHVVAPDLRGHGDSGWSPDGAYMMPYHLLDLVELVDALGPDPVTIVAHSFGGNIAARFAGLYPDRVRRIVFVDSLGPTPATYAQWDRDGPVARSRKWIEGRRDPRQASSRRFATVDEATERMAKANPRLSPDQVRHLATHGVRRDGDGWIWKFDPRVSLFAPEDFAVQGGPYWRDIAAPALILFGRQSFSGDPEADGRAAFLPDAQVVAFDDAGHWLHHDRPGDFVRVVDGFIAS